MIDAAQVKQAITLARNKEYTHAAFEEKFIKGDTVKYLRASKLYKDEPEYINAEAAKTALQEFLSAKSRQELVEFLSLMYLGRGGFSDEEDGSENPNDSFRFLLGHCEEQFPEDSHIISQMMQKVSLSDYWAAGLKKLDM